MEEGLNHLPVVPKTVRTPVGMDFDGVSFQGRICGVSIMRGELRFEWTWKVVHSCGADLHSWGGELDNVQYGEIMLADPVQAMEAGLRDCCRSGELHFYRRVRGCNAKLTLQYG